MMELLSKLLELMRFLQQRIDKLKDKEVQQDLQERINHLKDKLLQTLRK